MLKQVRRFLESHGEGRFTWWHRAASHPPRGRFSQEESERVRNDPGLSLVNGF